MICTLPASIWPHNETALSVSITGGCLGEQAAHTDSWALMSVLMCSTKAISQVVDDRRSPIFRHSRDNGMIFVAEQSSYGDGIAGIRLFVIIVRNEVN